MKDLARDADAIFRISNDALKENWGYVPLNRDELQDMFRKLKPIADPEAIRFMNDKLPVGYALSFQDLNVILAASAGRCSPPGSSTCSSGYGK